MNELYGIELYSVNLLKKIGRERTGGMHTKMLTESGIASKQI